MKGIFRTLVLLLLTINLPRLTVASQETMPEKKTEESAATSDLPLNATRKIGLTTDEATWLSLDVSPDGRWIVFDLLGDLYTLPIEGGKAERITSGMAFDSQPRFSPSGEWIAFISDRDGADNLWIARTDGSSPRKLSKEKSSQLISPAWMPDSQYVLVSKSETNGLTIHMYHVQGGSGLEVTSSGVSGEAPQDEGGPPSRGLVRVGVTVSPDGRYVYFAQKPSGSVYNQMSFEWQVYRRDLRSGDTDVFTQSQGGAFRPLLSPDGQILVYGTRYETETGLRVRDLNSGEDRWLHYPVQRDDMESRGTRDLLPGYAFMPDGREIVVSFGGRIHRVRLESGETREIPFSADVDLDIGPLLNFQRRVDEGPVRARLVQDPVPSPDGKRIAFSSMTRIYTMDLQERRPQRVTPSSRGEFKPAWSPDGKWITFVTWDAVGEGHIWKTRADGSGEPIRLTSVSAFYTNPVFSPDGSRIVARRGNAWMRSQTPSEFGGLRIQLDLVWVPAQGGEATLIVPARGLSTPHFTGNEPDRIYFYSREGLVSMRYDGTDRRTHLKITGKKRPLSRRPPPADDARVSPDGKWALAKVNNQLVLLSLPRIPGSSPTVDTSSPSLPLKQLTDIGADSFGWADSGKTVFWSLGSTFFQRSLDSISFRSEKEKEKKEGAESPEKADAESTEVKPAREEDGSVESYEVVLEFERYKPTGTLLLQGGRMITMAGDVISKRGDILITDNRITAVGETLEAPAGSRVIDVRGKTIVPGFIDTHAHYEMRTEGVLELHNWSFLANLAYGVTTGLDVQTSTYDYLAYQDLVEAGMMTGPRAYSTGPGVFADNDFQSYSAARHVLSRYKNYYLNNNLKSYMVGNRRQRQWVTMAAAELGLTVTTEGGLDLQLDITHAIDGFGGNEHTLPIIPLFRDVVELFARSRTAYTPTLLVQYGGPWAENYFYETTEVHDDPKLNRYIPHNEIDRVSRRRPWFREDEHSFPKAAGQAAKIQRQGGLVGVGGHGQLQGLGYHWEMWALSMGGMTTAEVLKAATIDGARIIGLAEDLGSIEAGKLADLVVLEDSPLEDIRNTNNIEYVIKNGELYEAQTMKQLWPRERELPPFWWWEK